MFIWSSEDSPSFDGYKLIMPSVSVGNVGQLAVDLIINTWKLPRVGYVDHPAILPLVGNDAFDHTHPAGYLHTAAEVYEDKKQKLIILQFRTPPIKHLVGDLCNQLLQWCKEVGVADVMVLTSSYAHERRDSQLVGEPFRFLVNSSAAGADLLHDVTQTLCWKPLEPRPLYDHMIGDGRGDSDSGGREIKMGVVPDDLLFLPGAGLAKIIYKCCNHDDVRLLMLVNFCSQGDNIPDAVAMANKVLSMLQKDATANGSWIFPSSWAMMYGGPSPPNIF